MNKTIVNASEGVIEVRDVMFSHAFIRVTKIEGEGGRCETEVTHGLRPGDEGYIEGALNEDALDTALDYLFSLSDEEREARRPVWDHEGELTVDEQLMKAEHYASLPDRTQHECQAEAYYLVAICDAPELAHDPDEYVTCREHASEMLGSYMLAYID